MANQGESKMLWSVVSEAVARDVKKTKVQGMSAWHSDMHCIFGKKYWRVDRG